MGEDIQDYVTLILHVGVVGLHAVEVSHLTVMSVGLFIAIAYMSLSSLEAYHIRKRLKSNHHKE